jgi:transketolase
LSDDKPIATRATSNKVLNALGTAYPELVSGSADLSGSNGTKVEGFASLSAENYGGRYIHWGIREHAMAAAMNGMMLHGGVRPISGTFLVFSDYCRPSLRLAALMEIPVAHVFSHDSIGVGEDGPTHQPVEHLAALRAIPNLHVFRPCDGIETAECWDLALSCETTPSALALTRQNLPRLRTDADSTNRSATGAYVLRGEANAEVSIFASGSEVSLAVKAYEGLKAEGIMARVVSVPCMDIFLKQPKDIREAIIGKAPVKIAVEAAIRMGWDAIIGHDGHFIGMEGFGASAPAEKLYEHFGITAQNIIKTAKTALSA